MSRGGHKQTDTKFLFSGIGSSGPAAAKHRCGGAGAKTKRRHKLSHGLLTRKSYVSEVHIDGNTPTTATTCTLRVATHVAPRSRACHCRKDNDPSASLPGCCTSVCNGHCEELHKVAVLGLAFELTASRNSKPLLFFGGGALKNRFGQCMYVVAVVVAVAV